MSKELFLFPVFIILAISLFSQNPEIFFEEISNEYPDERMVQVDRKIHFSFELKDNEVEVYVNENRKIIFLKNPSGMEPTQSLFTSIMNELVDFEANSYIPDGKKYRKVPVKEYKEKMNVDQYSFYDDIKELSFTFPGIAQGTMIEMNSRHKINEPRLIPSVYLTSYIPIRNFDVIIEYDEDIDLDLIYLNNSEMLVNFTEKKSKGKIVMTCTLNNLDKIVSEDHEPDITYFEPHLIPRIKSYSIKGKKTEVLENINSLHSWYYSLVKDIVESPISPEIKQIADSLSRDCLSEFQEATILYYWIQTNIKYIAFEYGLGGYVPRKPDATLKNRYGDCKDKTVLLYTLLKARNIKSYLTWIGTYDLPYSYEQVPTPNTDNHMIITYISDGKYYFLDGTNNYHNISLPSQFIQGKEALISISDSEFEIKTVPVQKSEISQFIDSVNLKINDRSITGNGKYISTGYHKTNLYHATKNRSKEVKKKIIEQNMMKGNNKFVLEDYTFPEFENFETEVIMEYDFSLNDYVQSIDNNLFINLNLDRGWSEYKTKEEREHPVFLTYATQTSNQYVLEIPEDYSIEYLPEGISHKSEHFYFHIKYQEIDNKLYYDHIATADILFVDQGAIPEWNNFIKQLEKAYKQTILLKKNE